MSPIRIGVCNCKLIIEFLIGEQIKKSCGLRHFVNGASLTVVLINRCQKAVVLIVWCRKAVVPIDIVKKHRITVFYTAKFKKVIDTDFL